MVIRNLRWHIPRGGSSSAVSRSNWNCRSVDFPEERQTGEPGVNLGVRGEPTTNSTHF